MNLGGCLTMLVVVLLAAGCDEYPGVTMINQSGEPISGIVVTLNEGCSYTVGSLDNDEETTICVEPKGESSLTLLYLDTNGELRL